jgi:hypothetical protein
MNGKIDIRFVPITLLRIEKLSVVSYSATTPSADDALS